MYNCRLAIILSHPTQYYSPWFRHLAASGQTPLRVFYLWNFGVKETRDRAFGNSFAWDIPLLDGYEHEFVENRSGDPGTHHFNGLDNPRLTEQVVAWGPSAILLFGYNFRSHVRLLWSRRLSAVPILFRGDSHVLCRANGYRVVLARYIRRILFRRFAAALAVGSANREYLLESGVSARRIFLVPHCVDNQRFQLAEPVAKEQARAWRTELGIAPHAQVVLFAGKFEEKKRPCDLLRAFQTVCQRRVDEKRFSESDKGDFAHTRNLALLFVGSGEQADELRRQAATTPDVAVFFAPFQNQSRMPTVYAAGDIFVLPSFGRSETWGLAVNEAMNLGKPVIVSSHVGCGQDLVVPGENGWVFPAGSVDDLAAVLEDALSDRVRLCRFGESSRRIVNDYSYDRATAGLIQALNSSLA